MQQLFDKALNLHKAGKLKEASELYKQILKLNAKHFDALHMLGIVAVQAKTPEQAIPLIEKAVAINPRDATAFFNLGCAYQELKQYEEALKNYNKAIALNPEFILAYFHSATVLTLTNQYQAAIANYDRVIALKPDYAEAYNNRGNLFTSLGQYQAALAEYGKAIAVKPDFGHAYNNLGKIYTELKLHNKAAENYEKALSFIPNHPFLLGQYLYSKLLLCDWDKLDISVNQLKENINRGENTATPFVVQIISSDLSLQRKAAEMFAAHTSAPISGLKKIPTYARHNKIRIGYFSGDFRNHAVSFLTAELFETHDKNKFELTAFSFGAQVQDEMRARIAKAFDRFIDVHQQSDEEVVSIARKLEIDIAIDLGGYTGSSRPAIFALRAAPVQISYIGFLGTMGADFIDYLIADPVIIPEISRQHYREKIVYLPSYQVNDSKRPIAETAFTRKALGLPETGFVFCCFNNTYKITPSVFDCWIRILKAVKDSVLLLFAGNDDAVLNLKREADARGISPERLYFGKHLPVADYLARYKSVDLFLDTLPYNGGTTVSDALWAGLPVLTCQGEAFSSRVAASVLTAVNMPELITTSLSEYETLAIELATHPAKLNALKNKLAENRRTTALFNIARFTRSLEAAYKTIYQRHHDALPMKHIVIQENETNLQAES